MEQQSTSTISLEQKNHIRYMYQDIFKPPRNINTSNPLLRDTIDQRDYETYQKIRNIYQSIGRFYEYLFAYLCNFTRPTKSLCTTCKSQKSNKLRKFCETCNKNSFDLINTEENIFIEVKSAFATDNYNARDSKFHHLGKYKQFHPESQIYYICLHDHRNSTGCNYTHLLGFRIITGDEAWKFFCRIANINKDELINFLREIITY